GGLVEVAGLDPVGLVTAEAVQEVEHRITRLAGVVAVGQIDDVFLVDTERVAVERARDDLAVGERGRREDEEQREDLHGSTGRIAIVWMWVCSNDNTRSTRRAASSAMRGSSARSSVSSSARRPSGAWTPPKSRSTSRNV